MRTILSSIVLLTLPFIGYALDALNEAARQQASRTFEPLLPAGVGLGSSLLLMALVIGVVLGNARRKLPLAVAMLTLAAGLLILLAQVAFVVGWVYPPDWVFTAFLTFPLRYTILTAAFLLLFGLAQFLPGVYPSTKELV